MENLETLVWIAGTSWEGVPGTDKRLVSELADHFQIVWVDPPKRVQWHRIFKDFRAIGREVAPRIWQVPLYSLPGITRPVIRNVTRLILDRKVRSIVKRQARELAAVVVAFPIASFPPKLSGKRILFVTDDWLESSSLTGFSRGHMVKTIKKNLIDSDVVAAVSPTLLQNLSKTSAYRYGVVLPNGCPVIPNGSNNAARIREIGLVGQLNERLDLNILEAIGRTGEKILVVGPRADTDPAFGIRLDKFLTAENVEWVGAVPASEVPHFLSRISVGITPYASTEFNQASFPLKTLEYLAAGVPVVATDMPAARWLDTDHIECASSTEEFSGLVLSSLDREWSIRKEEDRRRFAGEHSWAQRALEFAKLIGELSPAESKEL